MNIRKTLVLVTFSLFAAALIAGCSGGSSTSSEAASNSGSSMSAIAPISLSGMLTLGDAELEESLVASGFEKEADGSGFTFKKDESELYVDAANGYRVIYTDETVDLYQSLSGSGASFSTLSEYTHSSAGSFVVGVCPVEGDSGLVIAGSGTVLECLPGHMDQALSISPNIPVDGSMTAQEAAAAFADDIVEQGYVLSRGDKIDSGLAAGGSSSSASSSSAASASSSNSSSGSSSSNGASSSGASSSDSGKGGVPSESDVVFSNVALEPDSGLQPAESTTETGHTLYSQPLTGYFLTGTIENKGKTDIGRVFVKLLVDKHVVDSYGDEEIQEAPCSMVAVSPGAVDGSFYSLKAGEKREFRFALASEEELSNPRFEINSVSDSTDKGFDVLFAPEDVTGTIEQDGERHFVATMKNNTGKTLKNVVIYYAARFGPEEGIGKWEERKIEVVSGRLRPDVETQAVVSEFDDWYTDCVYLGTEYGIDKDFEDVGLNDEFSYEIVEGEKDRVLKLTNNTGHYLKTVSIWHSWWEATISGDDGEWKQEVAESSSLKPGETYEIKIKGPAVRSLNAVVNDIRYEIDEAKESA